MVRNDERRDLLRDAAIDVLATDGAHRLTHRTVDRLAGVPAGTTKNYFPTRQALFEASAARCEERYWADLDELAGSAAAPTGIEEVIAVAAELIRRASGPDKARVLAYRELQAEAARYPDLLPVLARINTADYARQEAVQRAAGLPVTPARAHVVGLAIHAALQNLLVHRTEDLVAIGLGDIDEFVRDLFAVVYPEVSG